MGIATLHSAGNTDKFDEDKDVKNDRFEIGAVTFRRHRMNDCSRLAAIVLALASCAASNHALAKPSCPSGGLNLKPGVEVIKAMRAYTGADGNSHVETVEIKGVTGRFFNNKTVLTQFDLGNPEKVVIVYGHPNMEIPKHPAPYPEKFLLIAGSATLELHDGTKHHLKPGTLFIAEDTTGTGRSGRAGPCGYVAIDLQYKKEVKPE